MEEEGHTTQLVNLNNLTLAELAQLEQPDIAHMVLQVVQQVARPRANLGSSGPPGRAD